jgi:hypothetical protein
VDPRAGLDAVEKRKILPRRELNPGRSARSSSLYRPSYPDTVIIIMIIIDCTDRVLLEKLIVPWLFKKFCNFNGKRKCIAVFIRSYPQSYVSGSTALFFGALAAFQLNAHRHPCLEWDSNLQPQRSSRRRQFML